MSGEGSCLGDSGGPLVTFITGSDEPFYEQVAIVSGGFGSCGSTEFPGIYVRLEDYQVLRWIYRVAFGRRLARPDQAISPNQGVVTTTQTASYGMFLLKSLIWTMFEYVLLDRAMLLRYF